MESIALKKHGHQIAIGSIKGFIGAAVSFPTGVVTAAFLSRSFGPELYDILSVVCFVIISSQWFTGDLEKCQFSELIACGRRSGEGEEDEN